VRNGKGTCFIIVHLFFIDVIYVCTSLLENMDEIPQLPLVTEFLEKKEGSPFHTSKLVLNHCH